MFLNDQCKKIMIHDPHHQERVETESASLDNIHHQHLHTIMNNTILAIQPSNINYLDFNDQEQVWMESVSLGAKTTISAGWTMPGLRFEDEKLYHPLPLHHHHCCHHSDHQKLLFLFPFSTTDRQKLLLCHYHQPHSCHPRG